MRYTVLVEKGRESGFVAYCPALRGCVSQGRTRPQVLKNLREAMQAYIEALLEDGLPVPTEVGRVSRERPNEALQRPVSRVTALAEKRKGRAARPRR